MTRYISPIKLPKRRLSKSGHKISKYKHPKGLFKIDTNPAIKTLIDNKKENTKRSMEINTDRIHHQ
jgi:hypothetical protein